MGNFVTWGVAGILAAIATYIQKLRELLLPILTREDAFPPSVFVRELTKTIVSHTQRNDLDLNVVMLMVWSEAQSNPKVKELLAGAQTKYRDALIGVVRKWQKRGDIALKGKPASIGKAMLSFFLGFIVQSAIIGGIDPDTASKGIEGLISSQSPPLDRGE